MPAKTSKVPAETYIATTIPGIEDITATECKGAVILPGRVRFSKLPKDPSKKISTALSIYREYAQTTFDSPENLIEQISKINIPIKNPFRVDCTRIGTHAFRSVDIEQAASKLFQRQGYLPDLKKPTTQIVIDIIENTAWCGILIQENLHKRHYRVKYTNQSINATLAAALVKIAEVKKTDTILDPFCKDGVIAIESSLRGAKKVYAMDTNQHWIRGAKINAKLAKAKVEFHQHDQTWLDTLFKPASIDKIITYILFSSRQEDQPSMLRDFFRSASHIIKKTITILTNNPQLIHEIAPQFQESTRRKITRGNQQLEIIQLRKAS